jgi:predicted solute-binding protein
MFTGASGKASLNRRVYNIIADIAAIYVCILKGLVKQVGAMNYTLYREVREKYRVKID